MSHSSIRKFIYSQSDLVVSNISINNRNEYQQIADCALRAKQYLTVIMIMFELIDTGAILSKEEMYYFAAGFKNVLNIKRTALKQLRCNQNITTVLQQKIISIHEKGIKNQIKEICEVVLHLLEHDLFHSCTDIVSTVFYLRLRADYYKHFSEVTTGDTKFELIKRSQHYYELAISYAQNLPSASYQKLIVMLNFSIFCAYTLYKPTIALAIAQQAVDEALREKPIPILEAKLNNIMNTIQENIALWKMIEENEDEDLPVEKSKDQTETKAQQGIEVQQTEVSSRTAQEKAEYENKVQILKVKHIKELETKINLKHMEKSNAQGEMEAIPTVFLPINESKGKMKPESNDYHGTEVRPDTDAQQTEVSLTTDTQDENKSEDTRQALTVAELIEITGTAQELELMAKETEIQPETQARAAAAQQMKVLPVTESKVPPPKIVKLIKKSRIEEKLDGQAIVEALPTAASSITKRQDINQVEGIMKLERSKVIELVQNGTDQKEIKVHRFKATSAPQIIASWITKGQDIIQIGEKIMIESEAHPLKVIVLIKNLQSDEEVEFGGKDSSQKETEVHQERTPQIAASSVSQTIIQVGETIKLESEVQPLKIAKLTTEKFMGKGRDQKETKIHQETTAPQIVSSATSAGPNIIQVVKKIKLEGEVQPIKVVKLINPNESNEKVEFVGKASGQKEEAKIKASSASSICEDQDQKLESGIQPLKVIKFIKELQSVKEVEFVGKGIEVHPEIKTEAAAVSSISYGQDCIQVGEKINLENEVQLLEVVELKSDEKVKFMGKTECDKETEYHQETKAEACSTTECQKSIQAEEKANPKDKFYVPKIVKLIRKLQTEKRQELEGKCKCQKGTKVQELMASEASLVAKENENTTYYQEGGRAPFESEVMKPTKKEKSNKDELQFPNKLMFIQDCELEI